MPTVHFGSLFDDQDFDCFASRPEGWWESAERLRRGARIVAATAKEDAATASRHLDLSTARPPVPGAPTTQTEAPTRLNELAYLLYAFGLENLLKAVLVARNPGLVSGGKLSNEFNHNLGNLVGTLNIRTCLNTSGRF